MNSIESSIGRFKIDPLTSSVEAHNSTAPVRQFKIALGGNLKKRGGELHATSFKSVGFMYIGVDVVTICTLIAPLIGKEVSTEIELQRSDIFNVDRRKNQIRFQRLDASGKPQLLVLKARNQSEAAAIVALFPLHTTPAFAEEHAAQKHFYTQLTTLTPHPWGTWSLIAVNSCVFIGMSAAGAGFGKGSADMALTLGSNFGPYTVGGEWWRVVTSLFIHFGFFHYIMNMVVLLQIGTIVERFYGTGRFVTLYILAGIAGSLSSLLWHFEVNSAGASGAIFGMLGALLAHVLVHRQTIPKVAYAKYFNMAIICIAYYLFSGFIHQGVDNGAHVGGLFAGFLIGWILSRPMEDRRFRYDLDSIVGYLCIAMALALLGGGVIYTSWAPDKQQEIQYVRMLRKQDGDRQQAAKDMQQFATSLKTPHTNENLSTILRTTLAPEWQRLYDGVYNTPLPASSPLTLHRQHLLTYYSDMSQMTQLLEQLTDDRVYDPRLLTAIKALAADAQRQQGTLRQAQKQEI